MTETLTEDERKEVLWAIAAALDPNARVWDDARNADALAVLQSAQRKLGRKVATVKVANCLVEFAPETDSSRGIDLLLRLISEATLKVSVI